MPRQALKAANLLVNISREKCNDCDNMHAIHRSTPTQFRIQNIRNPWPGSGLQNPKIYLKKKLHYWTGICADGIKIAQLPGGYNLCNIWKKEEFKYSKCHDRGDWWTVCLTDVNTDYWNQLQFFFVKIPQPIKTTLSVK